jgi:hypothetical protein
MRGNSAPFRKLASPEISDLRYGQTHRVSFGLDRGCAPTEILRDLVRSDVSTKKLSESLFFFFRPWQLHFFAFSPETTHRGRCDNLFFFAGSGAVIAANTILGLMTIAGFENPSRIAATCLSNSTKLQSGSFHTGTPKFRFYLFGASAGFWTSVNLKPFKNTL